MFWFLYIVVVVCFSYLISLGKKKKFRTTFCVSLVVLLTPAQIEVGSADYAPALFTFFFNVLLEQDFSLRALRPISLSFPVFFLGLWLFSVFKRKFFLSPNHQD
tara:strand:+ start:523 stop:834 length:312 start_codon:yes stop_codon:yes gene_type:complete